MITKIPQNYFLFALITLSSILAFFIFQPFLIVLVLAGIFAIVLHPLYRGILRSMPTLPGLASFSTIVVSIVCIVLPLLFIGVQIAGDAQHVYTSLSSGSEQNYITTVANYVNSTVAQYAPSLALSEEELSLSITQYTRNILQWLIQNLSGVAGSAIQFLLGFFIFTIALYYFLRDGAKLLETIRYISPLPEDDTNLVLKRLERAVGSIIRGSLTIGIIQGILTTVGFTFFGIPNSILWGVAATFCALIPGIGTSLILIPGVIYLFIIGETTGGIGLVLWSLFAVGLIDNFLGPKLVGKGMEIHPLLVFLSVFGGLAYFGTAGIFLGPLCISLLFVFFSISQRPS
jgi:predicted PurR-regulated permease PerM